MSDRTDDTALPTKTAEQSSFFHCRLCRHVGIAVFLSIVLLEGAILFYFERNVEQERLAELERVNFAAIQSLFVGASVGSGRENLLNDASLLMPATDIRGGALYSRAGVFLGVFGETPETRIYDTITPAGSGRLLADGTRYEAVWRFVVAVPAITMVVRLDATKVQAEVTAFFWRVLALVLVVSVIVTAVTMMILNRATLGPILALRRSLLAAGDNPTDPEAHRTTLKRTDELGDVFVAFNEMLSRLAATARDVELREAALRESEARFRDIASAASDWFWEMGPELQYTFISDRFFEDTGLSAEKIIGRTPVELIGRNFIDENPDFWSAHEADLVQRQPFRNVEYVIADAKGNRRHVNFSGKPIFDENGNFLGYRGTASDITQFRRAEIELAHHRKIESLGSLAGGIAHNLNNLLQPILILSEQLRDRFAAGSRDREMMDTVYHASQGAKELVDRIMAFSREQSISREDVDIYDIVHEGLELVKSIVPTSVAVSEKLDRKTGIAFIDPPQTQAVLVNLVANAIDAMEGMTGKLDITLARAHVDGIPAGASLSLPPGDYAKLSVTDNGRGMDASTQTRIFDPFYTTKAVGKGSGMGLSTSFGIIAKQGGTMRVASTPNVGTTIDVYIPLKGAVDD